MEFVLIRVLIYSITSQKLVVVGVTDPVDVVPELVTGDPVVPVAVLD